MRKLIFLILFFMGTAMAAAVTPNNNLPATLSTPLYMWFDFSNPQSYVNSSGNLTQANDLSSNAFQLPYSTAYPTLTTNCLNGLSCATFTSSARFRSVTITPTPLSFNESIFIVTNASGGYLFGQNLSASPKFLIYVGTSANPNPYWAMGGVVGGNGILNIPTPTSSPAIYSFIGSSSANIMTEYVNGTSVATTAPGASSSITSPGVFLIGNGIVGNIYEIIAYPATFSTTQQQLLEGYLACKWGLQSSLPTGHPYKTACPYYPDIFFEG